MYFIWKRSPSLRIAVALFAGVIASEIIPAGTWNWLIYVMVIPAFATVFRKRQNFGYRHITGILFTLSFVVAGIVLAQLSNPSLDKTHYSHCMANASGFGIKLKDSPAGNRGYYRCLAEIVAVVSGNNQIRTSGLISLQFEGDSLCRLPLVDEIIWVKSEIDTLKDPVNPGEFNYAEYLRRKGVLYSVFAGDDQWLLSDQVVDVTLKGWLVGIRENLLSHLRSHKIEGREYAVLAALLLGKTSDIDKELMLSYSGAGAVHILAVSGLHVALIYVLLAPVFNRFFPGKKNRFIRTLIPSILLWIYAGITGFSPSVLRAALMFTCFILADNFQKENNIYNTMGASVVLLILWQPNIVFETGFQLSYLAVLGIVILQKRILSFYEPAHALLDKAWKLIAVSIAAQITTLPYTLYYFDQFPTWFLLTNLLVIPLSTIILYCGLGSFALLWWSSGVHFTLGLTSFLTRLMNDLMIFIGNLPLAVLDAIHINAIGFLLLSLLLFFLCRWLLWFHARSLLFGLVILICFLVNNMIAENFMKEQMQVCFHAIRKGDAISFISGRETWLYADSMLVHDHLARRNYFRNYRTELGIQSIHESNLDSLSSGNNIVMLGNSLVCVMHETLLSDEKLPEAEYYYLPARLKGKERFLQHSDRFAERKIIFSAAYTDYFFNKWVELLPEGAKCYHLREGAMVINADHELKKFDVK